MPSTCSLVASTSGAPWTAAKTGLVSFTGKVRRRPFEPMLTNMICVVGQRRRGCLQRRRGVPLGRFWGVRSVCRDCKSPRRMRWACTMHNQVSCCWAPKTTARRIQTPLQQARVLDGDGFDCFFSGNTTDTLYASAYYGLLYRSTDGGRTMTQVANYFGGTGTVNEVGAWHTPFQPHPAVPGRIVAAKKSLHSFRRRRGVLDVLVWDWRGSQHRTCALLVRP